ncbi:MAG: hypothetical protein KF860_04030 [Cyclobacteriaceae bacterium]|nr:hypothetical protein [Cyclobacteriaceae bacterium]
MKSKLYYLLAIVLLASCSSPKYTYNFDYYDYNSGKKSMHVATTNPQNEVAPVESQELLASKENTFLVMDTPKDNKNAEAAKPVEERKTYAQMSKLERKELRADVKKYIKEKKESITAAKKANAMDHDLKLAAIFGVVGLVASIIGGEVFWLVSMVAIIIALVFFIKWLVRQ